MRMFVATMMLALIGGGAASGQDVGASSRLELDTRPTKVTAYRGRAWVFHISKWTFIMVKWSFISAGLLFKVNCRVFRR